MKFIVWAEINKLELRSDINTWKFCFIATHTHAASHSTNVITCTGMLNFVGEGGTCTASLAELSMSMTLPTATRIDGDS